MCHRGGANYENIQLAISDSNFLWGRFPTRPISIKSFSVNFFKSPIVTPFFKKATAYLKYSKKKKQQQQQLTTTLLLSTLTRAVWEIDIADTDAEVKFARRHNIRILFGVAHVTKPVFHILRGVFGGAQYSDGILYHNHIRVNICWKSKIKIRFATIFEYEKFHCVIAQSSHVTPHIAIILYVIGKLVIGSRKNKVKDTIAEGIKTRSEQGYTIMWSLNSRIQTSDTC